MKNYILDKKLEGLRGLCALTVAVSHFFNFGFFGALSSPIYNPVMHFQFAAVAVFIFFIISGYVMGISHISTPLNNANAKDYLKKRIIRLYPIYLIAILITAVYGYKLLSLQQVIAHLFFVQVFFVPPMVSNVVFWSLSYEVVYYLLFFAFWAINNRSKNYYLLLAMLIIAFVLSTPSINIFKAMLIGWIFWIAGLYISRLNTDEDTNKKNARPVISYFLILLATQNLGSGTILMRALHITFDPKYNINFFDLIYIPVCTLIVLEITRRQFRFIKWLRVLTYAIPAMSVLSLLYFKHDIRANQHWEYGILCFTLAVLLTWLKTNIYDFEKLNFVGRISYAIYVFHFPIGFYMTMYLSRLVSGFPLFIIGLISWIVVTLGISYLTELRLQPFIKNLLLKKTISKTDPVHQ
jgi:peptidoglycan/LPS O-acetylase OafA/YrhL